MHGRSGALVWTSWRTWHLDTLWCMVSPFLERLGMVFGLGPVTHVYIDNSVLEIPHWKCFDYLISRTCLSIRH